MRLTKAICFALGGVYASTHALRIHHDAASLAAGVAKSATTFDDPQPRAMRLMRRQRPTALDVAQHKREDNFEITTKTHTAHSTIQSTVTIVLTTTISVHGPPPRHSSGFPPSSSNGTVHLTDKMLSSNTGLPTITHSTLSFTLTTTRATCVTMAGGCVLCPGNSLDRCPGGTFTTPKGMPSGACAAHTRAAHAPGSGTSTVLAGETHKTTTSSSTLPSTHTTTSTHSSTPTHKTISTTSSTIVQKAGTTPMSPKDSAAFSFLDTAVDLEKQLLGYLHPDKSPAGSLTATSHLPPFATMRQEIAALSSELKDLAALHSSTTSMVPPAPFATTESPAPGCHANSNGSMILMVKPNHDEAQKPSATINDPVDTGKRVQLIDGKLMDKMGRHGFVNIDNTLQWLEPEGGQARISQFSVCGTENHLALVQTNKWWRCDVDGGHDFVSQPRGGKCPKVWLALVPEGHPPTTTALPPTTASTNTSTISVLESIPSSPVVRVAAPLPVIIATSTKLTTSTPSSLLSTKTTSSSTMLSGLLTTATAAAALDCHQDGPNGTMKLMVHHGTSMPQTVNLTDTGKRFSLHGGILFDMHGRIAAIQDNRMLTFLRAQDIRYAKWNATLSKCNQADFLGEKKATGNSITWFRCEGDLEFMYRDNPTDGHCDPVSLLLQEDKPVTSTHITTRPLGTAFPTVGSPRPTPVGGPVPGAPGKRTENPDSTDRFMKLEAYIGDNEPDKGTTLVDTGFLVRLHGGWLTDSHARTGFIDKTGTLIFANSADIPRDGVKLQTSIDGEPRILKYFESRQWFSCPDGPNAGHAVFTNISVTSQCIPAWLVLTPASDATGKPMIDPVPDVRLQPMAPSTPATFDCTNTTMGPMQMTIRSVLHHSVVVDYPPVLTPHNGRLLSAEGNPYTITNDFALSVLPVPGSVTSDKFMQCGRESILSFDGVNTWFKCDNKLFSKPSGSHCDAVDLLLKSKGLVTATPPMLIVSTTTTITTVLKAATTLMAKRSDVGAEPMPPVLAHMANFASRIDTPQSNQLSRDDQQRHDYFRSLSLLSTDGTCGRGDVNSKSVCATSPVNQDEIAKWSPYLDPQSSNWGRCCSNAGHCGNDEIHCAHLNCNPVYGQCDSSTAAEISDDPSVVTTLQLHPFPPRLEVDPDDADPRASDKRAPSHLNSPTHGTVISSDGLCGVHDGVAKSCNGSQFGDCCRDGKQCVPNPRECSGTNTCTQIGSQTFGFCRAAGDVPHMHVPAHRPNQTEGSSPDGNCGIDSGKKTCEGSKFGGCCGKDGTCGRDAAHCNAQDCSLTYSSDCSYEAETQDLDNWLAQSKLLSKNGVCGQGYGYKTICASSSYYGERQVSGFGHCCSNAGSCGIDEAHCAPNKCNPLFGECSVIAVQQRSNELNVVSDFDPHRLPPRSELDPEDVDPEVKLDGEDADSSYDLDQASPVPSDVPTMTLDGKCDVPGGNKTCAGSRIGECCSMEGLCGNGPDFCNENKCTNTYSGPSCGSDPIAIPYWHWYHNSMK
ncbi:hypothetical protein LTR95_001139 [Oleoguttula sp. CCFEE 5521]